MSKLCFCFIVFIMIFVKLGAEDLDSLLSSYESEATLSSKTKKQSAGILSVYTRADLEKMQIKSLSELLKNLVYYRYNEDKNGYADLDYISFQPSKSNNIRVYMNDNEIVSPLYGTGLKIYGLLDFALIDHVEIYRGIPSFEFGIEPASYVIKMYIKDPKKDEGGRFNTSIADDGTNLHNLYYAQNFEDFSYLGYISRGDRNRKKVENKGIGLSRDFEVSSAYLSLNNENSKIELQFLDGTSDNFMGQDYDATPASVEGKAKYYILSGYTMLMDKTLKLSISHQNMDIEYEDIDANPPSGPDYIYSLKQNVNEKMTSLQLKKDMHYKDNDIIVGLQFRDKSFNFEELVINGLSVNVPSGYDNEKIYSAYIEDKYLLRDNQILVASLKYDAVRPNAFVKDQNSWLGRLGYIYTQDAITFKTFYSHMEFKAEPILYFIAGTNYDLDPEKKDTLSAEITYTQPNYTAKFSSYISKATDNIYYNSVSFIYDNYTNKLQEQGVNVDYTYLFDSNNKIITGYFVKDGEVVEDGKSIAQDVIYGGYIRFLNSYQKFNFYNELIYRGGYNGLDDGYDYNFAVTYNHTKDFSVSLKGENIFDTALKTNYILEDGNVLDDVSVVEQRFWVTMEYLF